MKNRLGTFDMTVFITTLALMGFSIVLVYSSSFAMAQQKFGGTDFFLSRQLFRVMLSLVCFVAFINIDYHVLAKYYRIFFVLALIMLLVVLFMPSVNGAHRWIPLGFIRFQASEFAAMALVLFLAARLEAMGTAITEFKQYVSLLAAIGVMCLLVVVEPNFSTALILGSVGLAIVFMAGARFWHISALLLSLLPLGAAVALAAPYRRHRIMNYLHHGSIQAKSVGYQVYQSILGLGNGGLFGVGLGRGEQKYFFLPEPHTDFIFSIIGEELGFLGLLAILGIFAMILYRGLKIATYAPDRLGQLLAFGLTFELSLYVIIHAAVNVGLIPTTGVPLPFFSYGGMSLLFTASSMGILVNISSQSQYGQSVNHDRPRSRIGR